MTSPGRLARIEWARLASVVVQLGLCALLFWMYELQSKALLKVSLVAFGGFAVHHLLPLRLRIPFFVALSLAATLWVSGLVHFLWLLGLALPLIALCHAPFPFGVRVAALVGVAAALAVLRAGAHPDWLAVNVPVAVWPILGSLFMFRIAVYLYDLRHRAAPFGPGRALAYFFMLPNVCFPLFPVVDYKTLWRSHYRTDAFQIYQRGVGWILRGILHLLCYRAVKQHLLIDPLEVENASELAQSVVANFLLYLRISGDFHLIVGMLHLFGFDLSTTHRLYALSSSVSDFWRRINIYWRDFMEKLVFRPAYFSVRRRGETLGLIAATSCVFVATWALHSYQFFWIRGAFPIIWQDLAFWGLLGVCMVGHALYESKRGRARRLGAPVRTWRSGLAHALRVIGTFTFIVVAWSLWTAGSWEEWTQMMSHARVASLRDVLLIATGAVALGLAAVFLRDDRDVRPAAQDPFWRSGARVAAVAASLVLLAALPRPLPGWPGSAPFLAGLRSDRVSVREARESERGYYEELANVRHVEALAPLLMRPLGWNRFEVVRETGGFPRWELVPSYRGRFNERAWSTNRWGMRDRDYELAKDPGTLRIGLFGASHDVGVGVADGEPYESLLEARLNRDAPASGPRPYEVLNFSVLGYGPYERLRAIQRLCDRFDLDLVVFVVVNDLDWMVRDVADARARGVELPDPEVAALADRAGVTPGMPEKLASQRLAPHATELLAFVYRELAATGREHGFRALALLIPKPETETDWRREVPASKALLADAQLEVLDVTDAYDGVDDWETLWAEPWDKHPNALAHRLLAERLHAILAPQLAELGAVPR